MILRRQTRRRNFVAASAVPAHRPDSSLALGTFEVLESIRRRRGYIRTATRVLLRRIPRYIAANHRPLRGSRAEPSSCFPASSMTGQARAHGEWRWLRRAAADLPKFGRYDCNQAKPVANLRDELRHRAAAHCTLAKEVTTGWAADEDEISDQSGLRNTSWARWSPWVRS